MTNCHHSHQLPELGLYRIQSYLVSNLQPFCPPKPDDIATICYTSGTTGTPKFIGEKAKCLQELMSWEKKLKMATLLEEACKYAKFLQVQIKALRLMPFESSFNVRKTFNIGGELGMLNRQELLQVLVNSQVAQTMMYSQDCCVYSIEQYWLIKKITQKRFQLQQQYHV